MTTKQGGALSAPMAAPASLVAPLLVIVAAALSGCATSKAKLDTATQMAPASQTDVDYITYGTALVMFDREEGKIAIAQAKDEEVRATAQSMIDDADRLFSETTPIAQKAGITLPTILPFDLRVRLGHMQVQQGLDIDRTYVRDQIASHENALNALEAEAAGGTNPDLKAIAERALPIVAANLKHLRHLSKRMLPEG